MGFAVVWRLHMHQRRLLMSFDHGLKHIKVHCGEGVIPAACIVNSNEWSQNNPPRKNKIPTELVGSSPKKIQKITSTHAQHPHKKSPKDTPLPVLSCAVSLLHYLQGHRKSRLRRREVLQGSRGHLPNHPVLDRSQCHWRRHDMKCYWSHLLTLKKRVVFTAGGDFGW